MNLSDVSHLIAVLAAASNLLMLTLGNICTPLSLLQFQALSLSFSLPTSRSDAVSVQHCEISHLYVTQLSSKKSIIYLKISDFI